MCSAGVPPRKLLVPWAQTDAVHHQLDGVACVSIGLGGEPEASIVHA